MVLCGFSGASHSRVGHGALGGREHAACAVLVDSNRLYVAGGRTAPSSPLQQLAVYQHSGEWKIYDMPQCARWRHTLTALDDNRLLMLGGLAGPHTLHNTHYVLDTRHEPPTCTSVTLQGLGHRHSHTATNIRQSIYVYGGTDAAGTLPNDKTLYKVCSNTLHVDKLLVRGLTPRYGHSAVAFDNQLVIIGGISDSSSFNDIIAIDLDTLVAKNISLEISSKLGYKETSLKKSVHTLLLKHQAVFLKDEKHDNPKIMVIGGGALCFSFGTLFSAALSIQPSQSDSWKCELYELEESQVVNPPSNSESVLLKTIHDGVPLEKSDLESLDKEKANLVCSVCLHLFPSRNQLFKHIKLFGHRINP